MTKGKELGETEKLCHNCKEGGDSTEDTEVAWGPGGDSDWEAKDCFRPSLMQMSSKGKTLPRPLAFGFLICKVKGVGDEIHVPRLPSSSFTHSVGILSPRSPVPQLCITELEAPQGLPAVCKISCWVHICPGGVSKPQHVRLFQKGGRGAWADGGLKPPGLP